MTPESVKYSKKSLENASKWVSDLHAGGRTDILSPLQMILNLKTKNGFPRQIFLLTGWCVMVC